MAQPAADPSTARRPTESKEQCCCRERGRSSSRKAARRRGSTGGVWGIGQRLYTAPLHVGGGPASNGVSSGDGGRRGAAPSPRDFPRESRRLVGVTIKSHLLGYVLAERRRIETAPDLHIGQRSGRSLRTDTLGEAHGRRRGIWS